MIGPDTASIWNITGTDSGDIGGLAFTSFENLTGGAEADEFLLSTASRVHGTINGGDGDNRLEFTGTGVNDTVVISYPTVSLNSVVTTYANIGRIDVLTLAGLDRITVNPTAADFPATVLVQSGADDDQLFVNLVAGATTEITLNGGDPSASDSVTITGTADADMIGVDRLMVTFGGTLVTLQEVENLTVDGGLAADQLTLTGTTVTGVVSLLGGGDDDIITLNNPTASGNIVADGAAGSSNALIVNLSDDADTVSFTEAEMQVTGQFHLDDRNFVSLDLFTLGGGDEVTVTQTHAGTSQVDTGDDADTVHVLATAGETTINTGRGEDIVNIQSIAAAITVNGGEDNDTVNVGSLAPAVNGVLTGIAALLTATSAPSSRAGTTSTTIKSWNNTTRIRTPRTAAALRSWSRSWPATTPCTAMTATIFCWATASR